MNEVVTQATDKQQLFIQSLFGAARGNANEAMRLSGYSPNYSSTELIKNLKDQILEYGETYLAMHTPKAVMGLVDIIDDPVEPGNREKLSAINSLMDRVGLVKTEKVLHQGGENKVIFILPPKDLPMKVISRK